MRSSLRTPRREAASQVTVSLGEGSSDRLTRSSPGSVDGELSQCFRVPSDLTIYP